MKGALFTICLHLALISKLYHGCDVSFLPAILHESYESCDEVESGQEALHHDLIRGYNAWYGLSDLIIIQQLIWTRLVNQLQGSNNPKPVTPPNQEVTMKCTTVRILFFIILNLFFALFLG